MWKLVVATLVIGPNAPPPGVTGTHFNDRYACETVASDMTKVRNFDYEGHTYALHVKARCLRDGEAVAGEPAMPLPPFELFQGMFGRPR